MSKIHFFPIKTSKARKDYTCKFCDNIINKGSIHIFRAYTKDRKFNGQRFHVACYRFCDILFPVNNYIIQKIRKWMDSIRSCFATLLSKS